MFRLTEIIILYHLIIHGCLASRPPPPPSSLPSTISSTSSSTISQFNNKTHTISINTQCNRELFHMTFNIGKPFKGIIFAKDFMDECRAKGNLTKSIELTLPISGCGVRSELHSNGIYELSVRLVLQMDEKLRQSTDIEKIVRCMMPESMMDMTIGNLNNEMDDKKSKRIGRMKQQQLPSSSTTPRVRVWLELGGNDGSGAVEVGQPTTLAVRAVLPGNFGVHVVDCAALDGLGESSQKLLDDRGCPIDEQVMPSLYIRSRPAEDGWSKPNHDDIVEKLFTTTFPAFKFPDRERLHVSCGVQLCNGECPRVDCKIPEENRPTKSPGTNNKLARIEVFNSLSVTAPQIDLDRLRGLNSGNNVTVDEYPPTVRRLHSDGILCMSTSKLALAFCILGLIFLVAVIVSICCLLRSKLQKSSKRSVITTTNGNTSIFSSSSSSQFGSKLFIPYAGGTLPYGRVY